MIDKNEEEENRGRSPKISSIFEHSDKNDKDSKDDKVAKNVTKQ